MGFVASYSDEKCSLWGCLVSSINSTPATVSAQKRGTGTLGKCFVINVLETLSVTYLRFCWFTQSVFHFFRATVSV